MRLRQNLSKHFKTSMSFVTFQTQTPRSLATFQRQTLRALLRFRHRLYDRSLRFRHRQHGRSLRFRHRPDDRLCLRQGLSSGRAVTGLVGHHTPLFAVLGDALTAAQQLAQAALPHSTLLDQATYTALATFKHFVCVERKLAKVVANCLLVCVSVFLFAPPHSISPSLFPFSLSGFVSVCLSLPPSLCACLCFPVSVCLSVFPSLFY